MGDATTNKTLAFSRKGYGVVGEYKPDPGGKSRRLRAVLSDAYAFVRSAEANQALATVTLEELMGDQIKRNGDSDESSAHQYNPYAYDPDKKAPAGEGPEARANFLGGSDTNRPTKLDRLLAIQNELSAVIEDIRKTSPTDVASGGEYQDLSEVAAPKLDEG
jgi:hypothetical protein